MQIVPSLERAAYVKVPRGRLEMYLSTMEMEESGDQLVKLMTVSSEEKIGTEECPQVSLVQVASQEVVGDHCLVASLVRVDTEHITKEKDGVHENRLRVILRDILSGVKFYCWLFGAYSDAFVRLEVTPSDLVVVTSPRLVETKKYYRQRLPADISPWTVHCRSREKKILKIYRVKSCKVVKSEYFEYGNHSAFDVNLDSKQEILVKSESIIQEDLPLHL